MRTSLVFSAPAETKAEKDWIPMAQVAEYSSLPTQSQHVHPNNYTTHFPKRPDKVVDSFIADEASDRQVEYMKLSE